MIKKKANQNLDWVIIDVMEVGNLKRNPNLQINSKGFLVEQVVVWSSRCQKGKKNW